MEETAWTEKGTTLSHKTAEKEYGLTFDEIVAGIRSGKLQYRENNIYGNPFLRLIRREVEALVSEKYGKNYLKKKQLKTELANVKRELRQLKPKVAMLEQRKEEIQKLLEKMEEQ
jgi:hypothetical protein